MRKILQRIIIVLLLVTVVGYISYKVWFYMDMHNSKQVVQEISVEIDKTEEIKEKKFHKEIDFKKAEELNKDIVGWLYIPNTNIDEYVLQGKTNDDYLYRDAKGRYSQLGSLFLDYRTDKELKGTVNYLLGHNSFDGTKFTQLGKELNKETITNGTHKTLYYYLGDKELKYEIIDIGKVDPDATLYYDMQSVKYDINVIKEDLKKYNFDIKVIQDLKQEDTLLYLVTCESWWNNSSRTIVIAKLKEVRNKV